jgi:hypothetical protein
MQNNDSSEDYFSSHPVEDFHSPLRTRRQPISLALVPVSSLATLLAAMFFKFSPAAPLISPSAFFGSLLGPGRGGSWSALAGLGKAQGIRESQGIGQLSRKGKASTKQHCENKTRFSHDPLPL